MRSRRTPRSSERSSMAPRSFTVSLRSVAIFSVMASTISACGIRTSDSGTATSVRSCTCFENSAKFFTSSPCSGM